MNTAVSTLPDKGSIMENVLINGNLAELSPEQRSTYYMKVCESVGLNPLTKPFEYIVLNDKLTLYAKRDATDQLRKVHGVSITIVSREKLDGVYVVTAKAVTKDGREDESTGAVAVEKEDGEWKSSSNGGKRYFAKNGKTIPLKGDDMANAVMKAETKAKRRVTLSICGLGLLDESELETIADKKTFDKETGEILEGKPNGNGHAAPAASPAYVPSDPLRPHKDAYVIPAPVRPDGTLDFDEFAAELESKIMGSKNNQEVSLWNRANSKTLRAMESERPDLFQSIGTTFRETAQALM